MSSTPGHLREVLASSTAQYITVQSGGLILGEAPPRTPVDAQLISHGDARTLYRGRRPVCRSLDGLRAIADPARQCGACLDRRHCTPQIRLELHVAGEPYRLLLAYTSARNLVLYLAALGRRGLALDQVCTRLSVRDRGRWGEVCFAQRPSLAGGSRRQAT